jgi:hypothetical protein
MAVAGNSYVYHTRQVCCPRVLRPCSYEGRSVGFSLMWLRCVCICVRYLTET